MEHVDEALRIAKENGAVCLYRSPDWNGSEVWEMAFQAPGEPLLCTGFPSFIIFRDGKGYAASDEESLEYMQWANQQPTTRKSKKPLMVL